MHDIKSRAAALVAQMTPAEKASLCSGLDSWHTKALARLGLPCVCMTDGPHGLRKQAENRSDIASLRRAVPATCFPAACATACSWDEALLTEMGRAMAQECLQEEVAVLLGPGANAKRSPLCGRNFEYFSEDPLLSGKCAAALIRGIESGNVGSSLKHFAANNQEQARFISNSVVDERALREIYLTAFELAVKEGHPATVMGSYNLINEAYTCEDARLLNGILREEWGFDGLVMTDWGAMNERVPALMAGLDLEMPGPAPGRDKQLVRAAAAAQPQPALFSPRCDTKDVRASHAAASDCAAALDCAAARVTALALRGAENLAQKHTYDAAAHHALARRIAAESAVLLQNDGALPLRKTARVALLGGFAKAPRYQGAGSSQIVPTQLDSVAQAFDAAGVFYRYAEGFGVEQELPDAEKAAAALEAVHGCDAVVVCAGLPASYESEGFDREHLRLPPCQRALVDALCASCAEVPVIVVLSCGSSVLVPFANAVSAILWMGLAGQAAGGATADLLFGDANPCGKLAETWPCTENACGNRTFFGGRQPEYRESLYIGYRWFDKAERPVRWSFGHGLSYTSFAYADLQLSAHAVAVDGASLAAGGEALSLTFTVKNTGIVAGSEIAQVYVSAPETTLPKPVRELRAFAKVRLQPGERKSIRLVLPPRAFAYYNASAACWHAESGAYTVAVGGCLHTLPLCDTVAVTGAQDVPVPDLRQAAPAYFAPAQYCEGESFAPPRAQFEALLGRPLPAGLPLLPFTTNSAVRDLQQTFLGRAAFRIVRHVLLRQFDKGIGVGGADLASTSNLRKMQESMLYDMPLRGVSMISAGAVTPRKTEGLVHIFNGHVVRGVRWLLGRER